MPDYIAQKSKVAKVAARLADKYQPQLDKLKAESSQVDRSDFLWHYLLQSFATMGRSKGWDGLIGNTENYNRITYPALAALNPVQREQVLLETCRAAKIRMPDQKAAYIKNCYAKVEEMGGLKAANNALFSQEGREAKIKFLQTMPGIGPKYARNIMMDVYHVDFRDSIAIDVRIQNITDSLGLEFKNYDSQEQFYLQAAAEAGLNGWEMDRLLYNYEDEFKVELSKLA